MDTGGDRGERAGEGDSGSDISRRRFLAGSVLATGGVSMLVDGGTRARFSNQDSAIGTVQIDSPPNLNYKLYDQSQNTNAEYRIAWQVEWVANFDRIELDVENLDAGHISGERYTEFSEEGAVDYPSDGGSDGGAMGDTYHFTFQVYESGNSSPVIDRVVEDVADGNNKSEGDFGSVNSPNITRIYVDDNTQNTNVDYTVTYDISNHSNGCDEVNVIFDSQSTNWADQTKTGPCGASGSVDYYRSGAGGQTFDITVEVVNSKGIVEDSKTVEDTADGTDTEETF